MFLVYNSDVLHEDAFRLSVQDRAFQYGDGLFETIRYETNKLWFWPDHIDRLTTGMAALRIDQPTGFSAEALHQFVNQLLQKNKLVDQSARVKIQVWRQPGGFYTPTLNRANLLITTQPAGDFLITEKTKIGIYDTFRLVESPISRYKTLNSLPYILASIYKTENGFDDCLLLDQAGYVAECVASNVFWLQNDQLYTPSLETGCVNGILRRQVLRLWPETQEVLARSETLHAAQAIFCCNVNGIQWLRQLEGIGHFPNEHPTAERLFWQLLEPLRQQV
ncbi:aminotransferase class IV [Spirosoma montaniterrae]|uniref:branched-chain-amino-acid transaminase n=1 Tax=Spirosoma montaniterrae TaxID=1178516 RepID=A0A1P9WY98_9BACT|nr:aminotransferase class IV [Spirosoma montaniterrae]AQG80323.1 aminotransferase IV [Spirosoma montaniterrae]